MNMCNQETSSKFQSLQNSVKEKEWRRNMGYDSSFITSLLSDGASSFYLDLNVSLCTRALCQLTRSSPWIFLEEQEILCHHTEGMPWASHTHSACDEVNGKNSSICGHYQYWRGRGIPEWNAWFCKTFSFVTFEVALYLSQIYTHKNVLLEVWMTAIKGI